MTYKFFYFLILSLFFSCSIERRVEQTNTGWVGDIAHDSKLDSDAFIVCHGDKNIRQYFNMNEGLQIEGEKIGIINYFKDNFHPVQSDQSGWIRIRFIVNCKGETGRFRIMESDEHYQERAFDSRISEQLMDLTKSLTGWKTLAVNEKSVDYYQYLVFKIRNGEIEKIMP